MKRNYLIVVSLLLIGIISGGCNTLKKEEIAVKNAVMSYDMGDFTVGQNDQGLFGGATTASATPAEFPIAFGMKYIPGENEKTVMEVYLDETGSFATADVEISLGGSLELFDFNGNSVGIKDATLRGMASFTAEKVGDQWKVVDLQMSLTTSDTAPAFGEVTFAPETGKAGAAIEMHVPVVGETGPLFSAIAFNRAGVMGFGVTPLIDNGNFFNDVADDGIYSGQFQVGPYKIPGKYFGVMKGLAIDSVLNITKDANGNFVIPIKLTLQTFSLEVTE